MNTEWTDLDRELACWDAAELRLPLWWRDDDAVTDTRDLRRLLDLSASLQLPVHLAVIPRDADTNLRDSIHASDAVPVVHGWAHLNHAPVDQKKAEFGAHRPTPDMVRDARQGLTNLQEMFGARAQPMFVPPWNRIDTTLFPGLADLGFTAVSTFGPRLSPLAASGLLQINTHLDPINWRDDRSLVPEAVLIGQVTNDLRARRMGETDNTEPYGILTHHLVHDDAIWQFTETLISRLLTGPADRWIFEGPQA